MWKNEVQAIRVFALSDALSVIFLGIAMRRVRSCTGPNTKSRANKRNRKRRTLYFYISCRVLLAVLYHIHTLVAV